MKLPKALESGDQWLQYWPPNCSGFLVHVSWNNHNRPLLWPWVLHTSLAVANGILKNMKPADIQKCLRMWTCLSCCSSERCNYLHVNKTRLTGSKMSYTTTSYHLPLPTDSQSQPNSQMCKLRPSATNHPTPASILSKYQFTAEHSSWPTDLWTTIKQWLF